MKSLLILFCFAFFSLGFIEKDFFDEISLNWQEQSLVVSTVRELPQINGREIQTWEEMRKAANENVQYILNKKLSLKLSKMHLKNGYTILDKLNSDIRFRKRYNQFFYQKNTQESFFSYKGKYVVGKLKIDFLGENGLLNFVDLPFETEKVPLFESYQEYNLHYTGLLIDATSLAIKPILFPSIYTDKGLEIYSPIFVSKKEIVQNGYIAYHDDINQAFANKKKLGRNPLIVSAIDERDNMDLIISTENARQLLSFKKNISIIHNAKVVILLSKK